MILFCDKNFRLVSLVRKANLPNLLAIHDDIFRYSGVIVSASNPKWTFGGGLDALIAKHYPKPCIVKQSSIISGNERIGNVIFTITVNKRFIATPKLVEEAIKFAIQNHSLKEALLLSGLGTGIGGLAPEKFVEILSRVIKRLTRSTLKIKKEIR